MKRSQAKFDLIERIRGGEYNALLEVYSRNRNEFIVWAVRRYDVSPELAKDSFSEAVVRLFGMAIEGKLDSITRNVDAYLFTVARNHLLKELKEDGRIMREYQPLAETIVEEPTEEYNYLDEFSPLIQDIWKSLPEECYRIFQFRYIFGMRSKEIARKLNLKDEFAVNTRKFRCFRKIRKLLLQLAGKKLEIFES